MPGLTLIRETDQTVPSVYDLSCAMLTREENINNPISNQRMNFKRCIKTSILMMLSVLRISAALTTAYSAVNKIYQKITMEIIKYKSSMMAKIILMVPLLKLPGLSNFYNENGHHCLKARDI